MGGSRAGKEGKIRAMPNGKDRWPAQSRCSEVLPRVSARRAEADAKMALETLDRLLAVERKATADYGPHPRMQDAERLRREAEEGHERAVRAADADVQESLSLAHEAAVEALSGTPSTRTRAAAHRQYMAAFDRARTPWTRATQGTKEANEAMKEVRRLVLEAATVLSRVKVAPADAGALPRRRAKTGLNALVWSKKSFASPGVEREKTDTGSSSVPPVPPSPPEWHDQHDIVIDLDDETSEDNEDNETSGDNEDFYIDLDDDDNGASDGVPGGGGLGAKRPATAASTDDDQDRDGRATKRRRTAETRPTTASQEILQSTTRSATRDMRGSQRFSQQWLAYPRPQDFN
jgi:hypothetical protein